MDAEAIAQLWREIDTDNDGRISREQLKAGLRKSGVPFSDKGLYKVHAAVPILMVMDLCRFPSLPLSFSYSNFI